MGKKIPLHNNGTPIRNWLHAQDTADAVITIIKNMDAHVVNNIFNIAGNRVKALIKDYQTAGYRSVKWDAKDDFGLPVSAGIYFYQVSVGNFLETKKMLFLE